ncbi:MAG: metal ABC transporter ATP-binding protein [Acidimicrobiales bacterium]|nr:metal ABC transporter ATP-binding protein [Acidimicrobiaceae bacterium]MYA82240.1 metal ABC transporter ATP-binding protein [Acidimicrobiales bacterium]MYH75359.1 metal ABC transporter ATP-binding protein [Acidimicrobiales bacterium]MYK71337.1 metal ABC transporter ATP-binding protein [Acidimicrobiales bacterium]
MRHALFHLHDVRVSFGPCHVLETGDLKLDDASSVALMGPNGSGKTTLLRVLSGLQRPTSGRVESAGDVRVGFVCQHHQPHPFMPMTVQEVLTIGRYRSRGLLKRFRRSDKEAVRVAAERLDVAHLRHKSFGELSGGQRQRVMVAMVLASEYDCLLFDEPITGLDLPSQTTILEVIEAERAAGHLVVMSTHHLQEARRCDRVLLLKGMVLADGPPDEVLTDAHLTAAFGGEVVADGTTEHEFVMASVHAHDAVEHGYGGLFDPFSRGHHGRLLPTGRRSHRHDGPDLTIAGEAMLPGSHRGHHHDHDHAAEHEHHQHP